MLPVSYDRSALHHLARKEQQPQHLLLFSCCTLAIASQRPFNFYHYLILFQSVFGPEIEIFTERREIWRTKSRFRVQFQPGGFPFRHKSTNFHDANKRSSISKWTHSCSIFRCWVRFFLTESGLKSLLKYLPHWRPVLRWLMKEGGGKGQGFAT